MLPSARLRRSVAPFWREKGHTFTFIMLINEKMGGIALPNSFELTTNTRTSESITLLDLERISHIIMHIKRAFQL